MTHGQHESQHMLHVLRLMLCVSGNGMGLYFFSMDPGYRVLGVFWGVGGEGGLGS